MATADKLIELFNEAKAKPAGAERELFLAKACGNDSRLKDQVLSLLQAEADEGDSDFLKGTQLIRQTALVTEKPGDRIGRYKLLQQLGEGGCGVVYMAEQEEPVRRRVALKVIKLGMDTKSVIARFEAERQALALMDHPNIAKVFDAGATDSPHHVAQASPPASSPGVSHDVGPGGGTPPKPAGGDACATLSAGRPFFVMELVRGIKITEYCDQNNLSTEQRLQLFAQVCHAVQHAHQKGIIHRDLKPSNILVTLHDGVPVPKVIDFGIAKATSDQRLTDKTIFTAFEQFIGTPAYMSPEQAEMSGLDIDTRSDIYSLGVLLYELLTGRTPLDPEELLRSGMSEMRRRIREDEPPRPSTRLSTMQAADLTTIAKHRQADAPKLIHLVHGDLDWIVMKCLEKDRTRRYETANGIADDLKRHLGHEPVTARPPSAAYRLRKAIHRNKVAFAAGAAIAASLVIGIAATGWMAWRATKAEQAQRRMRASAEQARAAAEVNERKARDEAAKSSQAAKFIQSILTGLDLAATEGQDRTLLFDILMRALRRAETELNNQPEVQIEVVSSISHCLDRLGMTGHAYEIATRAMVLGKAAFGEDSPRTAELMTVAAMRAIRYGKRDDAETLATRSLAILRGAYGQEHPATLAAMRELGHVYSDTARPSEAESILREHMKFAERILDKNDEAQWTSRIYLARALNDMGRHAEAEPLLRETALGYERTVDVTSLRATTAAHLYCDTLFRQGKLREAEAFARSWANRLREVQMNHPPAVQLNLLLAKILNASGKDAEGGELLRAMFDIARATFGTKLPVTKEIMGELDRWYRKHDQIAEAERLPELVRQRPRTQPAQMLARMVSLEAKLRADNTDAQAAIELAARQAWLGRRDEWRTTSRRIVERLANVSHPPSIDRAAKSAALAPGADRDVLDKAAVLARRALEGSRESPILLPFYKMCVGMVEYRRGNFVVADAQLAEIPAVADNTFRGLTAAYFYRAMIAARQSRLEDARQLFAAGEAAMLPFPVDENAPLKAGGDSDDMINWLAYREAQAMLDGNR